MEEDISKYDEKLGVDVAVSEEEGDNWTFVHSEDVSCATNSGAINQQEDSSDNNSEQGSDSGSSIVVIDSPSLPPSDNLPLGHSSLQELLRNDEGQVEGLEGCDNISCSSNQSVNGFLKECSPYEDIEQPDSWDCDQEQVDTHTEGKQELEIVENEESTIESLNQSETSSEVKSQSDESQMFLTGSETEKVPIVGVKETEDTSEKVPIVGVEETEDISCDESKVKETLEVDNKITYSENQQGTEDEVIGLATSQTASNDEILSNDVQDDVEDSGKDVKSLSGSAPETTADLKEESSPEHQFKPVNESSDSEDDESEDDTWDLSLGGLANENSLASSRSSLVQQPPSPLRASPSPVVPIAEEPHHHMSLVKPDLLEEANRIEELDLMDYSAVTNPDLPAELTVANIVPDRHYVHHPNQRLNVQLSFFVAFALAAVVGFAIGNIVGLSDNFPSRCSTADMKHGKHLHQYEGWTEENWRAELSRLTSYNEELSRALKEMSSQDSSNCRFDFQVNELMTENWDLKQSIGRIRYGKPTRSVEDRDTINHLQTENQELRATVGKLRYRCGQPLPSPRVGQNQGTENSSPVQSFLPRYPTTEPLWKALGAINLTSSWTRLTNNRYNRSTEEQLNRVKESATNLIRLIGLRREELVNLTRGNSGQVSEKMEVTFKKSTQKTLDILEHINQEHKSFAKILTEVESRLDKIHRKLETHWNNLLQSYTGASNQFVGPSAENTKSLNADWFFSMGQQREKMRRSEKQSEWMFDRARNREQERKSRKFQAKHKKQKPFQGRNSWNHYSS